MLDRCEENRNEEIKCIELGYSVVSEEIEKEQSPWEKLQSMSTKEYLQSTIIPVLYPALEVIDIERPEDPVAFLAIYLLNHRHFVNIPEPTEREAEEESEQFQT
mmetsp:Transcript_8608/g.4685  ORF Transcript_8608/g.4685 Transcript_8608/m.4685 type:complete len:104 (+) Transcript_8608:762-1073(+)